MWRCRSRRGSGNLYHDHWLALVAASTGRIAYVDRPLYDYVQHPEAVIGHAGANVGVVGGGVLQRLAALRGRAPGGCGPSGGASTSPSTAGWRSPRSRSSTDSARRSEPTAAGC